MGEVIYPKNFWPNGPPPEERKAWYTHPLVTVGLWAAILAFCGASFYGAWWVASSVVIQIHEALFSIPADTLAMIGFVPLLLSVSAYAIMSRNRN